MVVKFGDQLDDIVTNSDESPQVPDYPDFPEAEALIPDPEPGWDKPSFADRVFPETPAAKSSAKKITVAVRKDIRAKTAMILTVLGSGWAAKDPYCGGALIEAVPDGTTPEGDVAPGIATALTDIFCDSPDIVAWFTTSGRYLKWLTLAMAIQPVLTMAAQHHFTHTVGDDEDSQASDYSQYRTR